MRHSFRSSALVGAQWVGSSIRGWVYPLDVLIRAGQQFKNDNGMTYAAAMSYYVLFSMFPAIIFLVTVFGFVVSNPEMQERAVDSIVNLVPAGLTIRAEIADVISDLSRTSSPMLAIAGLIGTAWTASYMFTALRRSLNMAFRITRTGNYLVGRFRDLLNLPAIMLLALLSIAATATVQMIEARFRDLFEATTLMTVGWTVVYLLLPYLISFLVFLTIYRVLPNARYPFGYLAIGAAFAAVGFELAKGGFRLYVMNFGSYQEVYGALGGVVAFLVFVFVVSNIVIFGAEISAEIIKDYHCDPSETEPETSMEPVVAAASQPAS
jgi:membrane protein